MADPIQSIGFQDHHLSWVEGNLSGNQIIIEKVLESELPIRLDATTFGAQTGALQVANHLKYLAKANEMILNEVRLSLPARMGLIKKILVDNSIPKEEYLALAHSELGYILDDPIDDFLVFMPEYERTAKTLKETMAVAVRKNIHQFFQKVAEEGEFHIHLLTLNAFTIDHLYRRLFCDQIGPVLLVNFTELGFEFIISDERNYIHNGFIPYTKELQSIQQIPEDQVLASFEAMMNDLKNPAIDEAFSFSFSRIYIFGAFLQNNWIDQLESMANVPVILMNPLESSHISVEVKAANFDAYNAHRFIEPLANLLQ